MTGRANKRLSDWKLAIPAGSTEKTIFVYQAFNDEIADKALEAGHFVPPFRYDFRTWIKPSLAWMLYRSGNATKPNQTRILRIEILKAFFFTLLAHAELTSYFEDHPIYKTREQWQAKFRNAPVQVQWDPARNLDGTRVGQGVRAIQIGITNPDWIKRYATVEILSVEEG